jgi:hypothetical protein
LGLALVARTFGLRVGVRQDMPVGQPTR